MFCKIMGKCSSREGGNALQAKEVLLYKRRAHMLQDKGGYFTRGGAFFTTEWDILYKGRGHVLQGEGACSREQGIVYKVMGGMLYKGRAIHFRGFWVLYLAQYLIM